MEEARIAVGWIVDEDAALKRKLVGLTLPDANAQPGGRPVQVKYIFPEAELGNIDYPLLTIEHQGIFVDHDREHRSGQMQLRHVPAGFEGNPGDWWTDQWPIPYNLDYLITTYTRFIEQDRLLVALLSQHQYLPARFGYLEVPEDGTIRRLDLTGGPWQVEGGFDHEGKRLFRSGFVIRVSSQLLINEPFNITDYVKSVIMNVDAYPEIYGGQPVSNPVEEA